MADNKKWMAFVKDINNALKLEPPYSTKSEEGALADIANRQTGEDAFVDEDYLPGNNIGLKDSTVTWLLDNDIEVPAVWKKRLQKQKNKVEIKPEKEVAKKEVAKKEVAKKEVKKTGKIALALKSMAVMIEKGVSKKDLIEALIKQFPDTSKNTFQVQLYKAMKKETCPFEKLVVKDARGILTFK